MEFDFYNNCEVLQKELVTDVLTTRADAISRVRAGHEIAPSTVANATKIIVLATKIQKLVAKLATNSLGFYILP